MQLLLPFFSNLAGQKLTKFTQNTDQRQKATYFSKNSLGFKEYYMPIKWTTWKKWTNS